MKVIINPIQEPMFTSFTLCADINKEKLAIAKEVTVEARLESKTRVSTSLQFGEARVTINKEMIGFNFDGVSSFSYFSGESSTSHFFKKSKKQNLDVYLEYLKVNLENIMVNYFNLDIDTLTVNFINKAF